MEKVKCCGKIVVKFGGSSLTNHKRLSRAVAAVVNETQMGTLIGVVD
jgi:aspartokinase